MKQPHIPYASPGRRELVQVRGELAWIEQGYWRHSPAGIPVPGFFAEYGLCLGALPKAVRTRFLESRSCLRYGTYALELEHRMQPIRTAARFAAVVKCIAADGYDMAPARDLSEQVTLAWDAFAAGYRSTDTETTENNRRRSGTDGNRRLDEEVRAELHRYPVGFRANMTMIRSILAMQ